MSGVITSFYRKDIENKGGKNRLTKIIQDSFFLGSILFPPEGWDDLGGLSGHCEGNRSLGFGNIALGWSGSFQGTPG